MRLRPHESRFLGQSCLSVRVSAPFGARFALYFLGKHLYNPRLVRQAPNASDCWGVAKLVKAPDFDSGIRRFESFFPSH